MIFLGLPAAGMLAFALALSLLWVLKGDLDGMDVTLSYSTRQIQMEQITMDSETFLVFMLAGEVSPDEKAAFLRAGAIVARSKLWYEMKQQFEKAQSKAGAEDAQENHLDDYVWQAKDMDISWISVLDMQQQWGDNFGLYYQRLMDAVQDTAGEILTCNHKAIEGRWHAVSAGNTRSYTCNDVILSGVEGNDRLEAGAVSICYWSQEPALTYLKRLYSELDSEKSLADQIQIKKRDSSDYIMQIQAGEHTYTGEEAADLLGLPSSCFYLYDWQKGLRIVVRGQGSGYGISLRGAAKMAKEGADENEILQYYYPEAIIEQGTF